MLGFLQGFAYGLFLSCLPWFVIGLINPRVADPTDPPRRWKVWVRYGLGIPFLSVLLWLTSLWGGFSPSLLGWLAGLTVLIAAVPLERRWRRWWRARAEQRREAALDAEAASRRAQLEREEREIGVRILDPARPPQGADEVVVGLCRVKGRLLAARRPDLATQPDRLYTRYVHVGEVLAERFDRRELTFERSRGLIGAFCTGAIDTLERMAALAEGVATIDVDYVRRRLARTVRGPSAQEREALNERLALVEDTERRLAELSAANEAALTTLDRAIAAVSQLDTQRPQAALSADLALSDLQRFIDNAALYGRRSEVQ